MALSLRNIAQNCLGVSSPSVLHDVFGYLSHPGRPLSLKRQLELVQGPCININAILVAIDNFTWQDWEETQYAIQVMREIYSQVNLGVRRINWQQITAAQAGGYATIDSGAEAHDLTDDWNGPDGGFLDVFVVLWMTNPWRGWAPVVGPCSKDDKDLMTGAVVSLMGNNDVSGIVFAHEAGHYLGASQNDPGHHSPDSNNFMHAWISGFNNNIKSLQGSEMLLHCYVHDTC
jgi:hypothetical protein